MDAFSYLSVLLSLILGLAITQILQGVRGYILARPRVRHFAPSLGWAVILLAINVQSWWAMFGLREVRHWSFGLFALLLAQTTAQYLIAALLFPDFPSEGQIDLHAHYFDHARAFFSFLAVAVAISMVKELALGGHLPTGANLVFHLLFVGLSVPAIFVRSERFHHALMPVTLAVVLAYIVLLFTALPTA